jgi:hypothetical protein
MVAVHESTRCWLMGPRSTVDLGRRKFEPLMQSICLRLTWPSYIFKPFRGKRERLLKYAKENVPEYER